MSRVFSFVCAAILALTFPVCQGNVNSFTLGQQYSQESNFWNHSFADGPPVLEIKDGRIVKYVKNPDKPNVTDEDKGNEIVVQYEKCVGFEPEELEYIRNFIDGRGEFKVGILQCIEMVFGKPFFTVYLNLVKADSATSFYDASRQVITLQPRICRVGEVFPKIETLAHELIHAYSDKLMKPMNCFEEGMAVAQTDLVGKLFCQFNGITDRAAEVFDGPPVGVRNYDLLNQEAAAAADGFFWNSSTTTRVVDPSIRYLLAGTAWWKIWRESVPGNISIDDPKTYGPGTFFVDFNQKYFARFNLQAQEGNPIVYDEDRLIQVKSIIKDVLNKEKSNSDIEGEGNSNVEGLDFEDWWSKQYIFRTWVDEGPKLYVTQTWQPTILPSTEMPVLWDSCGFPQIAYYYKDFKGNEVPLSGKLTVTVTSLSVNDYGNPLNCQCRQAFWTNGSTPFAWSEFEIENGQVAGLVKSGMLSGSLDFSNLQRTGVAITFTATTYSNGYKASRTVYFPVKMGLQSTLNLCYGTVDAPGESRLFYERSSMPGTETEIPVNGDGTYVVPFAACDVLTFRCRFVDEFGEPQTYETTVSAGTQQLVKNLNFRE